ncbi:MAG: hypothetical protein LBS23_02625 [Holosporaceae bacterium]|jgi:hypothetical protein|nr:hypothetical protein [Holosporaceae bacterium]
MSFWSNAVKLIGGKSNTDASSKNFVSEDQSAENQSADFDFALRNYVKESFSVLIIKPLSNCALKIMKISSLIITGLLSGTLIALLCGAILLQFGSIENVVLSSLIISKFEKLLPDVELSMKSAMLQWNPDTKSVEIVMKKARLNDLLIPKISILPNYIESLKQQRLITKSISLINPKININAEDDFQNISFNPNFEKGGSNKSLFEPIYTLSDLKNIVDKNTLIKLINANISICENGIDWNLNNAYCEYNVNEPLPSSMDCSITLPTEKYTTNLSLKRTALEGKKSICDIKIESLNPFALNKILIKRSVPLDARIHTMLDGYCLPVSGNIKLNFDDKKFLGGRFNLSGGSGAIRLPAKNSLSLNLGKRIDNGSVCGSFSENRAVIDFINISYGNCGLQLTGIEVPLSEYKFLDIANIDGTLSLTNIDVQEMEAILPDNISKSMIPTFKNFLPGFRLELFKVDLKGPVVFANRTTGENFVVGQGVFKMKNAKIPIGEQVITNLDAIGNISNDGFDVKLSNANFGDIKVNNGVFFISKKDNSWIGRVNADMPLKDISSHARNISHKLALLPIEKLNIRGIANFDMKLVRIQDDFLQKGGLPFRIIEGAGTIKTKDNTGEFSLSWNDKGLFVTGDVNTGKNSVSLRIEEDFKNNSGVGTICCDSSSDFLNALIPSFRAICDGDFRLKINTAWYGNKQKHDISLNLKNSTFTLPMIGALKEKKEDGVFTATILKKEDGLEFSKMQLNAKNSQIRGRMTFDNNKKITKCILDKFVVNGCSAKINFIRDNDHRILFSAVGDSLNVSNTLSMLTQFENNTVISTYLNLQEMIVFDIFKIKNVKGSLSIKGGKIIDGACYGVVGKDTTLALTAKDIEKTNESIISISSTNAGELLKYMRITDTILGGNINFVIKVSKDQGQSFSGAFEMKDFIVKNNIHLTKLISLSSTNLIPNLEGLVIGFNLSDGKFVVAEDQITLIGRAVSPAAGISYSGSYDRISDNFNISGISVPSSPLNSKDNDESFVADYYISGSLGMPVLSVKPLKLVRNEMLKEIFGQTLAIISASTERRNDEIEYLEGNISDPFSHSAFDGKTEVVSNANVRKSISKKQSIDKKFGVKITRGVKNS